LQIGCFCGKTVGILNVTGERRKESILTTAGTGTVSMTPAVRRKKQEELQELRKRRDRKSEEIRGFNSDSRVGDFCDRAGPNEAQIGLVALEKQIEELDGILKRATDIPEEGCGSPVIQDGSKVTLKRRDLGTQGKEMTYNIAGIGDPREGCISQDCPLASALIGHCAGESITLEVKDGRGGTLNRLEFEIQLVQ
jgi:transcription elongation GreA/GreB family factor